MPTKNDFDKKIRPELAKDLGLNILAVPSIEKITVNIGLGQIRDNKEQVEVMRTDLALITGQKPSARKSRKAIAGFKLRQGEVIGYSVTLRGERMYSFLTKLVNIVIPRIRDFRGLSVEKFDGKGNYSFGIKEHTIFPEIEAEKVKNLYGLSITITTSAKNNEAGEKLLRALGLPFKNINN